MKNLISSQSPLDFLHNLENHQLFGQDHHLFLSITQQTFQQLTERGNWQVPPQILLAESNPMKFLANFLASCAANCPVFLGNPHWTQTEWQQVFAIMQPDLILGTAILPPKNSSDFSPPDSQLNQNFYQTFPSLSSPIFIPTGGTSGQIRFAIHTWDTLMASVRGFQQYFRVPKIHSCCVLPLYHVSGLMQFMRSVATGGQLVIQSFKALENDPKFQIKPENFFISLVPTQLKRLLQNPQSTQWLAQFKTVLLGGAAAWPELLQQARNAQIPLALTYGMTETASQIAALKPEEFLAGNDSNGQILPHAKVTLRDSCGNPLNPHQIGIITLQAESLAWGYYPDLNAIKTAPELPDFSTDDLGFFDEQGYLTIVGRNSDKIITGGENVYPAEVEAAIQATHLVTDICVIGLPDLEWGQVVTAVYVSQNSPPLVQPFTLAMAQQLSQQLSKFKHPKHWIPIERMPRNAQGKINRQQIQELAEAWVKNQASREERESGTGHVLNR